MKSRLKETRYAGSSLFLSAVFLLFHYLYFFYAPKDGNSAQSLIHPLLALFLFPLLLIVCFNYADAFTDVPCRKCYAKEQRRISWGGYFIILLLFWLPYYLMCFPGNLFFDTGTSILYNLGLDRSNVNNPFFQNFLMGTVYRLGKLLGDPKIGIGIYVYIQFFLYLVLLSYALFKNVKNRRYIMITLVYALVPAFPLYAVSMGKDTNFALCILLFSCLTLELIEDKEAFFQHKTKAIMLAVSIVLMGLFRNYAVYVPAISLLLYSLFSDKDRVLRVYSIVVCVIAVFISSLLPRMMGVPKPLLTESLSLPLQQIGYYYSQYKDELSDEETEELLSVFSTEILEGYNPSISDPIKSRLRLSNQQLHTIVSIWIRQFSRHPISYLKAAYYQTYAYYSPLAERGDIKNHAWIGFAVAEKVFEKTDLTPNTNEFLKLVREIENASLTIPILSMFTKIGIYTWMLIISIVRLFQKHQKKILLSFSPVIMVLIGCLLSPVNGYYRYAFPMILSVPILFVYVLQLADEEKDIIIEVGTAAPHGAASARPDHLAEAIQYRTYEVR